jgi:tripartite ATP-independent transporter DctM subunit
MTRTASAPEVHNESSGAVDTLETAISLAFLTAMAALPLMETLGREFLGQGIPGSSVVVQHLTLVLTFAGAAHAARSGRHLTLATQELLPPAVRRFASIFSGGIAAAIVVFLLKAGIQIAGIDYETAGTIAWGIPVWVAMIAMPAGYALIAMRLVWRSSDSAKGRSATAVIAASVLLLFWFLPQQAGGMLLVPGLVLLLAAAAVGVPIFAAMAGIALLLFWADGTPIMAVAEQAYRLSKMDSLAVIPLYTLSGFLLSEGGSGQRLLRAFNALLGWMPGSLAIVTTVLLAFFTPLTGASGVTILSLGGLLLPLMIRAGYPAKSSMGLVTVSGSIGLLLPPSTPVILFAIYAHTPIPDLFIGSLIPGSLLVIGVGLWGARAGWIARAPRQAFRLSEFTAALWHAKWDLLMPIVIAGGIFSGYTSAEEAAAVTVAYAFIVECIIHRDLRVSKDLTRISTETASMVGGFLIILSAALGLTYYLDYADVPVRALGWVQTHVSSPLVFLLALNIFLILVGALMDIYSAILVVVPLIIPMAAAYGIDPVHLGVVFLANMELGYLMPPMGENLFLASYRFNQPLGRIYAAAVPFLIIILAIVLLITYVPSLTTAPVAWFHGSSSK